MELESLLSNFNSPKEGLEYLKDRTNNNVNWENLSKASEEIAKNQGGDKDSIALQIIGQYSQGENPLFNFEELKAPPAIQGKDLQKYDTNITSLEGIKNLGLDVIDTLGLTGFSENASKRRQDTMRYLQQSAKDNIPYDNLDEQSYWALSGIKGSAVSRHEYENLKKTQELISKTENDLTQDDKNFINKQLNPISHFFSDYTKEDFEEFKDKATQDLVNADVQSKLNFLNTIHQEKSITSILTGSDEKTKNDYLQAVQTIAKEAGFEGIAYDKKGDVFFYDHENFYKPNQDFFGNFLNILASNAGSIGGGITGAIVGAKNAKNPQQALIGSVVGAGIGSFIGASSDVLLTNARLNRENTLKEVLAHSLEEGTLSVVGDLAIMGGAMAVKNGLKILKDSNVAQKTSETFKNIVEYTPIIGFVSRFQDANAKSALKLISNTIDETQQKALHDFGESFGGNIKFGSQDNFRAYENIKAKFGENHFITKGAKIINDAFMLKSQSQAQKTILQAIRADESGNLVAFLSEAANASPTLQNSLKSLLNQTTFNLKKQLQYLDLKPNEVKEIFDTFQKGTKTEYAQAIDEVLTKVYDDTYKVQIDPSKYNNFRIQLEQSGVLPQDSIRFLEFAQKNIYNQQGVSFTQLNNALKQINSYYKTATDPNFKDFTAKALENFLRDDIKQGIDSIFAQNKTLYKDAQSLFSSALSDYGKMKATLKLVDKIKLRDESISYEQAFKNLYEYVKGQGGELQNLTKLTQHLDKNSAQRVELSILYNLFNQNIKDFKDIQVFDSQAFFKNLESIKDHFNTQSAKDFIDIAKGFDTLFKNDVLIANAIRNATTDKISSSIATTIQGAVKFQLVRMMFENIVRLLPNIPFMSSLNEKVQGASLRFHIKSALMKNLDVQDFKISLSNKAKYNKEFNSQTKQALENIIGKIDKAQDDMLEVAQRNTLTLQRKETLEKLQYLKGKQATNKTDGRMAYISKDGLEKMLSGKAIGKSLDNGFSLENHLQAVENVLDLFTNAILVQSQKPNNNSADIIAFHKYLAPFENADVKLTIKELNQNGNKIYSLELLEMSPVFKRNPPNANTQGAKDIIHTGEDRLSETSTPNNTLQSLELKPSAPEPQGSATMSKNTGYAEPDTPTETPNTIIPQSPQDIKFIDTKGKEHTLTKEVQEQWLKTFNLKSLDETYIPNFTPEVKQALDSILQGEQIKLTKGSLLKLMQRDRLEFLPYIKDTLESPQVVVRQVDGALIFAKDFRDDKLGKFFASVSKNDNGEWVISSNAPKNLNNLQNKIKEGGEVLYSDLPELPIIAKPELPAKALNSEANLSAIIPQSPQDIKFIDTKGKEHTLSKDTQEQWLQTFGLQNLEQSYIPKHSQAIQQALGGKEIKLQKGSLLKLVSQGREQYIPQIKEVLDNPEAIIRDSDDGFLFIRHLKNDDFFVNVSYDKGEYLVSISNGIKETRNLKNKLDIGGEIIYQSPSFSSSRNKLLQTSQYSANTIDKEHSTTKNTNELEKPTTENYSVVLFSRDNATNEAQLFGNSEQPQVKTKDPTAKEAKNITFIDAKGKEREITKQVQEQWLETFNLKSLDEDFIPQFSDEVRQALNKAGITQDFHLKLGSLIKLDNKQREAFLPYIKPTIEYPDLILDDGKGILFIKEFVDSDKNRYFMSVAKDFNDEWIFSSHTRRELKDIQKKTDNSRIIYNNGFKGGEVAGASDILESGGTTTKPSDLQITYPANHSSGKNPKADSTTKQTTLETNALDDNKLKEFEKDIQERLERVKKGYSTSIYGTSYDSKGGYVRLLSDEEKHNILYTGYNEKLLDKYLELKNNNAPKDELNKVIKDILEQKEVFEKHEHFKNAQKELIKEEKIKEFDKEAYEKSLENKSENEIKKLYEEIFYKKDREDIDHIKENILSNILYRVPKEAQGDFSVITKIVSLKERVSDRDHYDKNYLRQTREYLETKLNIIPIKEFGTNYAEFYKDGKGAIQKLLSEAKDYETRKEAGSLTEDEVKQGAYKGQVAGAFHKEDLGDIDLVWGEVKGSGKDAKGFGLSKILEKHIDDFKDFVGDTKEAKLVNGINEIIENGKVVKDSNGRRTIVYNDYFKIGLKQNWKGETTPNNWVITAYEDTQQKERDKIIHSDSFTKGETLPLNSKEDSTTKTTNIQNTATQHNPSIPTPQELQIQVSKAKADIDELMKNPQIVDTQWLYRVNKPQEVEIIQAHYFNQEIPQEYQEIIAPFPKLREQEIADTLKQHTQTQLKQAHKEQFLETFKDKPFKKTRIQASNLLKTYYEHNPKGLGVEIKDWNFESANFKMALAKFQTKLKKGDEEVFETLWEAKFAKNIQDKRQEIQNLFSINPIKEFGTNYAEFYKDGKGAIQKLLSEAKDYETRKEAGSLTEDEVKQGAYKGQVAGAFHKEGLGDIDLVWGNEKIGLAHILERRTDDFIKQGLSKEEAQTKARELIGQIPEILEQSTIYRQNDSKIELITSRHTLVLGLRDDRKFIITELIDKRNKKRLGSSQTGVADTLTDETLTNKSLSSSQHLDTSTTPVDPHQSGFADSNFSTSLKSEAKNDFNPTTKDLIQQSKYLSKIMDLNKKNNKGTLDKKNKLIQEFKQKEPQIYQAMVRKEVYRHYHNKGLYLDDHIVDPDDFLDQYNYIYKREQARQNQNHKHHIETKLEQYKEELENILNNLDSIKNPITQLKKLNLKIAKLPIKQAFGDPVHKDAVLSLSDTIDTALSDIFAKLPQYTENKKQILQESKTKTQEFITYMQEVRGDIDYMLDANPKAIKPYMQERLKEAKPYEKKFLERIQDQVKQIEEKNKDSAPNLSTKEIIKQAKEQGLSQVQSNTNAQQLTLHDIQERLTARKKELEQQSKDLSTELKTQEKQANRVAPILKELLQKWRALNPLIIEWKERKEIRGKFGQFLGYEKKLSKRKPNLSNLEHIEKTLEAYKSYAKNNEDSAESVKKEISLLEDYVEKLKNKQNIQNLIEHSQSKEQILSDERRKINTYHDLRQNFNKGHHTDLQILEGNNIPQEQHKQLLEFISQTRSYIESNFNINPLKEFGTNYAEFYKDGKGAIQKLLSEAKDYETRKEAGSLTEDEVKQGAYKGQVAGAFYKEGLGDIDLVWGDSKMGLQKIITKHIDDFNDFAGETQQTKLANGLSEIIENGKVVGENGVNTIWYKRGDDYYLVGLSKGFNGIGENEWIITSYEKRDLTANQKADINSKIQDSDTKALSPVSEFNELQSLNSTIDSNPTTKGIIKQAKEQSLSVQETKEATQDSTQATQDLTHLKQKLENASDEEKGEIIKEAITEQNNKLLEEITKLQNVLEKKDFLPFEIDEKIKSLSTKSQFIGEDEESLKKVAISQLEFETKDKIKELQKVLKDNKIGLGTLKEFLTKAKDPKIIENKTAYESVKATLKRLIEKNQKRVLKILDNAIQERKLTYYLNTKDGEERGRKLFYSFKPDTEQIELFEKIFPIAQKLGVEVKQAINNEFLSKEADGVYYTQGNSLRVKNNRIYQEKGKVFLHELIHSVTSRAMIAYESGKRELLSPNQIVAINNIQKLYKEVYKNHKELGFETFESFFTRHKGDYGLKNSHEFVAELSNPIFREKLKKVGVFEKLVDNILRLFVSAKEALLLKKNNAYDSLKKNLYEIIDNYKDDFTANYEKENIKGVNLEQSKELESRFLNSTGDLNIEALKNEATKLPKVLSFREFKEQFRTDAKGNAKVNTLIGEIKINVPKAYNHFVKNTYNVDRKEFSGAFLDTLVNPLFIVRQKYRPKVSLQGKSLQRSNNSLDSKMQNKSRIQIGDKEIIQDSYVFYKPFVNENGLVSLASFAISQNGELLHKTFYDIKTLSKLKKLIKGDDEDLLYFKNSKDLLNPQELKTTPIV